MSSTICRILCITTVAIAALTTGACSLKGTGSDGPSSRRLSSNPTPQLAQSLLNSGDLVQAAHVYAQLSTLTTDIATQQDYQLFAAELYFDSELYNDGTRMFAMLPAALASEPLQQRRNIVQAFYSVAQRNPQQALDILPDPRVLSRRIDKARTLEIQARIFQLLNDPVKSLKARVQLEANLSNPESIGLNQKRIWDMLQSMDAEGLQFVAQTPAGPLYRGWVEYAMLARAQGSMDADTFSRRQALWSNRYGNHPAINVASNSTTGDAIVYNNPAPLSSGQIALLLPLSGQFSELGTAIKNGFTAAHYDDGGSAYVRIYDTQSDSTISIEQYQLATAEGASLIIGPLSKTAVVNLAASNQIIVPTLSLNYLGADIPGNSNLYQFGLLPEDEAVDAANFANRADYRNAIIIYADNVRAQRLAGAFAKRFSESGGAVLGEEIIEEDTYDYSQQLRKLLAINSSHARKRQLEQLLDTKLEFEPAIRDDIDVIFSAVDTEKARLLRPQLKFHRAGTIPLLSTAMVFSGQPDPKADKDLTGIRYNEIPWLLTDAVAQSPMFKSVAQYQPDASPGFARLAALGMDAYTLHKELDQLRLDALYSVDGKTGALSLASGNRIQRRLQWAEFQEGVPGKIADSLPVEAVLPPLQESGL